MNLRHRWLIILAVVLAGAAWLVYRGQQPVVRGTVALDEVVPFGYMLTAFPVLGMLVADWVDLWLAHGLGRYTIELGLQLVVLVVVSNIRLVAWIPLSGHVLLFVYFILRRWLVRLPAQRWALLEAGAAVVLLLLTLYIKLVWWGDVWTVVNAAALAAVLAAGSWLVVGRNAERQVKK